MLVQSVAVVQFVDLCYSFGVRTLLALGFFLGHVAVFFIFSLWIGEGWCKELPAASASGGIGPNQIVLRFLPIFGVVLYFFGSLLCRFGLRIYLLVQDWFLYLILLRI